MTGPFALYIQYYGNHGIDPTRMEYSTLSFRKFNHSCFNHFEIISVYVSYDVYPIIQK